MKRTIELLQMINAKRNEVMELKAANKVDEAVKSIGKYCNCI